ncbi:MAG: hypothetical protein GF344_18905 [Chitinivibrionales bacterium]|nr:hypothetical protein [Chitinivibrionales bacterium]MBD3358704.1 hypothetical protein [Chitinivibrionales bacterium]
MDQTLHQKIQTLYAGLPEVACQCCGLCCVSPTCTLAEFIYLFDHARRFLAPSDLRALLATPPQLHPDYEGNSRCPFLRDNRCGIHAGRTGACRLFGIPSLAHLRIDGMEQCKNTVQVTKGQSNIEYIEQWLNRLVRVNEELHPFGVEPYFLRGLNIHCWLDIYFDELFDFDIFGDIRRLLHANLDLAIPAPYYTPSTNLREKVDKIGILPSFVGCGDRMGVHKLLVSIRDDYPLTGTYFYEEVEKMLEIIDAHGPEHIAPS